MVQNKPKPLAPYAVSRKTAWQWKLYLWRKYRLKPT